MPPLRLLFAPLDFCPGSLMKIVQRNFGDYFCARDQACSRSFASDYPSDNERVGCASYAPSYGFS